MTVLVKHDIGCKNAREEDGGGHSDAAKRLSDTYNLHRLGAGDDGLGRTFAFPLAGDRSGDGVLYPDRETAAAHQHHNEDRYAYIRIGPYTMSVCEAASTLRWQRQQYELQKRIIHEKPGLEVIPRLTREGVERQIGALRVGGLPVALGKPRGRKD